MDIFQQTEVTDLIIEEGTCVGVRTNRYGDIRAERVGSVAAGNSSVIAAMGGFELPLESHPLQALVSEPIKPILDTVVMSNHVHGYISQSDKGDLVIGAGIDGYNGYGQRGSFPTIEHTLQAILELFPIFSRVRMNRQWGGSLIPALMPAQSSVRRPLKTSTSTVGGVRVVSKQLRVLVMCLPPHLLKVTCTHWPSRSRCSDSTLARLSMSTVQLV